MVESLHFVVWIGAEGEGHIMPQLSLEYSGFVHDYVCIIMSV